MLWRIATEDESYTLTDAMRFSDARKDKFMRKAEALGVKPEDIRVDRPRMERKMARGKDGHDIVLAPVDDSQR